MGSSVAVLGAGGWGTALAVHLARVGHDARLWGRDASLVADMRARRANAVYLPDILFPDGLMVTGSLEEALQGAQLIVAAVPSHGTREIPRRAADSCGLHSCQRHQGPRAGHAVPRVRDRAAGARRGRASGRAFRSELR